MNPSANAQVIGDHSGDAGQAAGRFINALLNKLVSLSDWTPARETFTKQTTSLMWQNNPDPSRWVGAACYNKGWHVKDPSAISDVVSMKLSLGALNTNYDCMYIGHNNQFYTDSDGGYINVSGPLWRLPWELVRRTRLTFNISLPTSTAVPAALMALLTTLLAAKRVM